MEDVEWWLKRYEQARARRSLWDDHWRQVSEYFWPSANDFMGSGTSARTGGGEKRTEKVFDVTGPLALDRGAGGLSSLVIPQSERWHLLRASDESLNEDPEVKEWFEQVVDLLFEMRASPTANFYAQAHEGFMSELAFGNHCQFVEESPRGGVRYRNVHIGQVAVETDAQGRVDTVYRLMPLSAKQAQQLWGHTWGDKPPDKIKAALEQRPYDPIDFLHIVAPRKNVDPERMDAQGKPYQSLYLFPEEKRVIEEGGYEEFPYQYPRWTISPMESYGRGPGMLVLPTIKVLNAQEKTVLKSGHNAVEPPLLLADDGVFGMGSKTPRFTPGAAHFGMVDSQGRPRVLPLQNGARLELTFEMQEQKRTAINSAFHLDLFQILVDSPQMTATEVLERVQEKGQLLAPSIGRMQSEWFGPQIHRELGILARQGLLPPMPQQLAEAGGGYEVEYQSPATRMQRTKELTAISRTAEFLLQFAPIDPTIVQKLDLEESAEIFMDVLGGPSKALLSKEEFAKVRQAQAQAAEQAQQAAMMQQGATTAKDATAAITQLSSVRGGQAAA